MYKEHSIAVVIPAFNEAKHINKVIESMPDFIDQVIVIDDGSIDSTEQIARECGACVIRHQVNRGVGAALHSGIDYVLDRDFDIMVNIDGDGQFSTADIVKLIDPIVEDRTDFTTASRFADSYSVTNMPRVKRWGNWLIARLISLLTGSSFRDVSCGMRAYSKKALLKLNLSSSFTYTHETFLDLAFKHVRIMEIPVEVSYYRNRKSRVSDSVFWYAIRALTIILRSYRDYQPLKFFWMTAAFFLGISIFFFTIIFIHYLKSGFFSGQIWAGFVGGFFFLIGMCCFFMGILGDMFFMVSENQEKMLFRLKRVESLLVNQSSFKEKNSNINWDNGECSRKEGYTKQIL